MYEQMNALQAQARKLPKVIGTVAPGYLNLQPLSAELSYLPRTLSINSQGRLQGLREWQAYKDCRLKIDEFLENLSLVEFLSDHYMRARYLCACSPYCK